MFKKKKYKLLSWIITIALLLSNLTGFGTSQNVKAEGIGTSENPYTVADAIANNKTKATGVYVTGYIVGTSTGTASWEVNLVAPFSVSTNLGLADNPTETDKSKIIPVQLSGSPTANLTVKNALNLPAHPENLAKKVTIKGDFAAYFSLPGLKNTSAYEWVTPTENVSVTGITLDKPTLDLSIGKTSTLVPTIAPVNATNKNVTLSSSDIAVATVENGVVTGVKEGTATITVSTEDGAKTSLCVVTVNANAPPQNKTFDIVEITDFHGQLLDSTNKKPVGAALAYFVKNIKTANPDTLVIGGGDLYQGTPISNVLHGVPVRDVMDDIGMEVTTLGNHEFDWGLDVINSETMKGANYSIVCANMYNTGANTRPYAPYKVITKDGVRIAVIGAILKDAKTIIMPALTAPFDFRDPAAEINTCAKEIRDGNLADIVLADVHDGGASLNTIVNNLHGVDAVFGGHTHTSYDAVNKDADGNAVPTLNAAATGQGYIDLKITVDSANKITGFSPKGQNWKPLTTTVTSPTDPTCKDIVDKASDALLPIFNEVIGKDDVTYTSGQVDSPYGESQLGNWMADVVKNYVKAEVGMVNNGGIRLSPIPSGDITVGTIFSIMPFDNTVTTVVMTGAQLKTIFEQAVQDNGKGIQISGVKFVYDSSKPSYKPAVVAADGTITTPEVPGQRVLSITRESDNSVVKDTDSLVVAAPDFVATGGDTFTEFLDPMISTTYVDSHVTVRDALNADVRAKGKITVVMNNRVDNQMQVVAPTAMSIAEARTTNKTAVILTGIVSVVNGNNVFMQDYAANPTAGICVYNSGGKTFTVHKGDKITVTGNLSTFNGLLEVTPTSASGVETLGTGNVVTPKEVTVGAINSSMQGQLIKVKSVTFTSIDNAGASMAQDSTGSINVYKMPVVPGLVVNDTADVTAAVTQYNTTIELAVDSATDVVKSGTTPVPPVTTGSVISIVATSDVHGNMINWDYGTNAAPSKSQGLAKVSTYVKGLKATNPNVMLVDNGDTIQGTPLVYVYNMIDKKTLYPTAAVMGAMGYDTETLGNHEFNYGLETLYRVISDYKSEGIHVLSANTYKADSTNFVEPYFIKSFNVNGNTVKVGILGLTTKCIPWWEDPAHYTGLHFNDLVDEAKTWVPKVRAAGADVVIVTAHTGEEGSADIIPENEAKALATQVSGIDAIVAGHAHSTINDLTLKNPEGKVVPVIEPGKWANTVSRIDLTIDDTGKFTGLTTKNVNMDNTIAEDPAIVSLVKPYQDRTLAYTATVLGQSTGEYKGDKQLVQPTEIMELINKIQAKAAGTQLSIAAPLSLSAYIPKGDITIKDIMGVYVYENFLFGVKMTGKQVKDWMEYTVRYYKQVSNPSDKVVKDPKLNIADYNLDQLYGATYDIDLTEPACTLDANGRVVSGNRIKNLKYNRKLIKDTDVFTVAINNYRYNGGGGFMAAAGISNTDPSLVIYDSAKALGDDGQVRSLMMKYIQDEKTITPTTTNNWALITNKVSDTTAPVITVTGIENGKSYTSTVTPSISTDDKDATITMVLNGKAYSGEAISSVGTYTLIVNAQDKAGNIATDTLNFTIYNSAPDNPVPPVIIDTTPPVITISGVQDGNIYNKNVTPIITLDDKDATLSMMLNGKDYKGEEISAEGSFTLAVKATDKAGNSSNKNLTFVIDKTTPVISIYGVEDGRTYNNNVTPIITLDDKDATLSMTLNGKDYRGEEISTEGSFILAVKATDKAGNSSIKSLAFVIDKTMPVINIYGVEDGHTYNNKVIPIIIVDDKNATLTMTLNGKDYKGTEILTDGNYKLVVNALDKSGNLATKTISFTIQMQIVITGEVNSDADAAEEINKSTLDVVPIECNTGILTEAFINAIKDCKKNLLITFKVKDNNNNDMTISFTVKAEDLKPLNFVLNEVSPNDALILKLDSNSQIISFSDNGILPADTTIRIKVDTSKLDVTKDIFLYYYNPITNKAEKIGEPLKVDSDGYVVITIKHCSDYFLSNNSNVVANTNLPNNNNGTNSNTTKGSGTKLVQTGSIVDTTVMLVIGALLMSIGLIFVNLRKKLEE